MKHINFKYLLCEGIVWAASTATRYLRGFPGTWSRLPEICFAGWSLRRAQHAQSCTSVARLWKSSSRMPGRLEFDEICNPIIYYLSKDFYAHAHVHVQAHVELHTACSWSNSQKSTSKELALPPEHTVLTAQVLLTVILIGTCMRLRDTCWAFPYPLCLSYACFRHYVKLIE